MKIWIVSFLLLFFAAETAQWLGQLPWVNGLDLSMPLTVLGGVGLAIASNSSHRFTPGRSNPAATIPATQPATNPAATSKPLETPPSPPQLAVPKPTQSPSVPRKADTISFEIKPAGQKESRGSSDLDMGSPQKRKLG